MPVALDAQGIISSNDVYFRSFLGELDRVLVADPMATVSRPPGLRTEEALEHANAGNAGVRPPFETKLRSSSAPAGGV